MAYSRFPRSNSKRFFVSGRRSERALESLLSTFLVFLVFSLVSVSTKNVCVKFNLENDGREIQVSTEEERIIFLLMKTKLLYACAIVRLARLAVSVTDFVVFVLNFVSYTQNGRMFLEQSSMSQPVVFGNIV